MTLRGKKQPMVARSTAEVEFRSMAHGIYESLWLKMLLTEVGFPLQGSMSLYCDNKAAINIAHDLVQHDRTKHVEVDKYFIKDHIKKGNICIPYIQTKNQLADVFTKGLRGVQFMSLISKLGMIDIFSSA